MALNTLKAPLLLLLLLLLFFPASTGPPPLLPPAAACRGTQDPAFCASILAPHGPQTLHGYGRFSLAKSHDNARDFAGLVGRRLRDSGPLSPLATAALQDCVLLSDLSMDYLATAMQTLNTSAGTTVSDPEADAVQTLLSSVLTNQETCTDGIAAAASTWPAPHGLDSTMANSSKLYSVSLTLYNKAWGLASRNRSNYHTGFMPSRVPVVGRHGHWFQRKLAQLPSKMSGPESRRQLLQNEGGADSVSVLDTVMVSQDGSGNYTTVGAAVAAAPSNLNESTGYYLIYVTAGVYEENVVVPATKRYLIIIGDGVGRTVVTGNRSTGTGWTTFSSATFAVIGKGFIGVFMTIRNTAGPANGQAVALRSTADLSAFYNCSIEGYQDTLYAHSMRQFYRGCDVYGTVDYIFGNAAAVFQACNIYPRLPLPGQANTVTAQARSDPNQNTGTSMQGCRFAAAPDLAAAAAVSVATFLGRPWRNYSTTVVMQSYMDSVISASGWTAWSGTDALSTLYYAEYNNTGPGSGTSERVRWPGYHVINGSDASNFTVSSFLLGDFWLPQSGVPYSSGLL